MSPTVWIPLRYYSSTINITYLILTMKNPYFRLIFIAGVAFSLFFTASSTLTPKSPKSGKEKTDKVKLGPVNHSVGDRFLVVENPSVREILNNHQAYFKHTDKRNVKGMVLGYVTPWNNHGYDVAKIFANKFTHISPVWLQVKRKGVKNYQITGTHDIDQGWMSAVWKSGEESDVKIVPRVLFDRWHVSDFDALLNDQEEIKAISDTFIRVCKKWGFEGYVLELWTQVVGLVSDKLLIDFIKQLGKAFADNNFDLILVVPPKRGAPNEPFSSQHFNELYDSVTAFSLMTYDFSNPQRPGPNAPIKWMEDCILFLSPDGTKREKILTGFNFYGNAYTPNGGGPIVGHEYLRLLKNYKGKLQYDANSAENFVEISSSEGRHFVFYPTLYSISKRVELCRNLGTGVSVWELGQGLDYFYDLL